MNKKYVVVLTEAERERLRKLLSAGTAPARMLTRARILLKADQRRLSSASWSRSPTRRCARRSKNELRPHLVKGGVIPSKKSAAFVCRMEEILDLYEEPQDPLFPVVCFDERPCQLLLAELREPLATGPGRLERRDHEYERRGTAHVLMAFEPLAGWRKASVTERRRGREFAEEVRCLAEEDYPEAEKIRLVLDNLSTHSTAAFYESFPPDQARRLARRIEFVYTPVHGSWLNMVDIELSVLVRQG